MDKLINLRAYSGEGDINLSCRFSYKILLLIAHSCISIHHMLETSGFWFLVECYSTTFSLICVQSKVSLCYGSAL